MVIQLTPRIQQHVDAEYLQPQRSGFTSLEAPPPTLL
jgi:hypothetical protein